MSLGWIKAHAFGIGDVYRDGEQDLPKEDLGIAVVEAALPLYKAEQVATRGPDAVRHRHTHTMRVSGPRSHAGRRRSRTRAVQLEKNVHIVVRVLHVIDAHDARLSERTRRPRPAGESVSQADHARPLAIPGQSRART